MYYITVRQSPHYHQMSLEEFLFGKTVQAGVVRTNETNTRTYEVESISSTFRNVDIESVVRKLKAFNVATKSLHDVKDRHNLYRRFYIPKRSGGLRQIDAPNEELMAALRLLKGIFEDDCNALYHTSAFAYIKGRNAIGSVKRHQANESKWFAKFDFSNFFGSTTPEFITRMLGMIYPFCEIMKRESWKKELVKALDLAFLDGGLPQGTPFSPTITNIMMIPIDYKMAKLSRDFRWVKNGEEERRNYCVYTRYADDILVSSNYDFDFKEYEKQIMGILEEFEAPFKINSKKTRYGSSNGSNWNLGVMLNRDNKITIGHQAKKRFQAMLSSFCMDSKNGIAWDPHDISVTLGYVNYYKDVEGEAIDALIKHINEKFDMDVVKAMKDSLYRR